MNKSGTPQNLKPVRSVIEARKKGKKGGEESGKSRQARKTLKDELLLLLGEVKDGKTANERISVSLITKALNGDTKAFEIIRDTVGEKPVDELKHSGGIDTGNNYLKDIAAQMNKRAKGKK